MVPFSSICLWAGILAAVTPLVVANPQVIFPPLTKHAGWASQNAAPWEAFVRRPSQQYLAPFFYWLFQCQSKGDIPSLYHVSTLAWRVVSPVGARGAIRQHLPTLIFVVCQMSVAFARLRSAYSRPGWSCWFKNVWKALPESTRCGIISDDYSWWRSMVSVVCGNSSGAAVVYSLFCHGGQYIGKANLWRESKANGKHLGFVARVVEHFVGASLPRSRDGSLPRYRILRTSFGSLGCIPLVVLDSVERALACERALIVSLKPVCNGADWTALVGGKSHCKRLSPGKAIRRRPIPPLRAPQLVHLSIWDQLQFQNQLGKVEASSKDPQGAWPRLPYGKLYRHIQNWNLVCLGICGPLTLFGPAHFALFVTFMATRLPHVFFPGQWGPWEVAEQLYGASSYVDKCIRGLGGKIAARRAIEFQLRRWRLPPLQLKPLLVPRPLIKCIGKLRRIILAAFAVVRNPWAKRWLCDNIRILPARIQRWNDRANIKAVCCRQKLGSLCGKSLLELERLSLLPSLRGHLGSWRLPVWPKFGRTCSAFRREWSLWTSSHRLSPTLHRAGRWRFDRVLEHLVLPEVPWAWYQCEQILGEVTSSSSCLALDDKLASKVWSCDGLEFFANMLVTLRSDPMWRLHPAIDVNQLRSLAYARSALGLPHFLRSGIGSNRVVRTPVLFGMVKSKCFSDAGEKVCTKPGHSCIRRVMDTSGGLHSASWKLVGRGIRGAVMALEGYEIFEPSSAIPVIKARLAVLACGNGFCKVCGKRLAQQLNVFSCDVDQAFEACNGESVSQAWAWVSQQLRQRFHVEHVQVRRGRVFAYRLGTEGWSRGWVVLTFQQVGKALRVAASTTLCSLGDVLCELSGMAIGGSCSSPAVAVRFAHEESEAFTVRRTPKFSAVGPKDIQWCRYVDDVLSFSRTVCSGCMGEFFASTFDEPVSVVFSSDDAQNMPCTWLLYEFHICGGDLLWSLKNANRPYVHGVPGSKFVSSVVRWPGSLPMAFQQVRSMFISKIVQGWAAELSPQAAAIVLLEFVLELLRLDFPMSLLRALVHALPKWPETILARRAFRVFASPAIRSSSSPASMGYGDGRGSGNGQKRNSGSNSGGGSRGQQQRGYNTDRPQRAQSPRTSRSQRKPYGSGRPRKRSSSSSSSSSSREKAERKLRRAQKTLSKADPSYTDYLRRRQEQEEEDQFKRQGAMLADVLQDKFGASLSSSGTGNARVGTQATTSSPSVLAGSTPAVSGQGFSAEQLEQIKALIAHAVPAPAPPPAEGEQLAQLKLDLGLPAGSAAPVKASSGKAKDLKDSSASLSPLQVAVINSLFAGKVTMSTTSTVKDFEAALLPKWSQRDVPQNLSDFITENAPAGIKVAKGKSDRMQQFWETLVNMH